MTKTCPVCAHEQDQAAQHCPRCGWDFSPLLGGTAEQVESIFRQRLAKARTNSGKCGIQNEFVGEPPIRNLESGAGMPQEPCEDRFPEQANNAFHSNGGCSNAKARWLTYRTANVLVYLLMTPLIIFTPGFLLAGLFDKYLPIEPVNSLLRGVYIGFGTDPIYTSIVIVYHAFASFTGLYLLFWHISPYDKAKLDACRQGAEHGDADAQFELGLRYEKNNHVRQDYNSAAQWYLRAADQAHPLAQYRLGRLYEKGRGVVRNRLEAARRYKQAAEQGNVQAQRALERLSRKAA